MRFAQKFEKFKQNKSHEIDKIWFKMRTNESEDTRDDLQKQLGLDWGLLNTFPRFGSDRTQLCQIYVFKVQ